jgi:hypothetical protein
MYHSYCKNWKTPAVVAECDHGHGPSELSCLSCFYGKLTLVLACIWIKVILVFKLLCFRYFWTWVVITLLNSDICWITYEMDVTYDLLCWTTTILVCMLVGLKSLMILLDYRSYRSLSTEINCSGDCFCTFVLIIWAVPWHLPWLHSSNLGAMLDVLAISYVMLEWWLS